MNLKPTPLSELTAQERQEYEAWLHPTIPCACGQPVAAQRGKPGGNVCPACGCKIYLPISTGNRVVGGVEA